MTVCTVAQAAWRATPEAPKADVSFVPMMMRRRLTSVERAAFRVAWDAVQGLAPAERACLPVVFASRWGEIGTTFKLMQQMHEEGAMSPAGFSASVHNAMPGAWSLFTHDTALYTALAAGAQTREMGALEAQAQLADIWRRGVRPARVLLVCAEEETPEFYRATFPNPNITQATASLLEMRDEAL